MGTPPVARGLHGTTGVYDPASNRMMVFGGRDANGDNLNDVWILTNANRLGGSGQWLNLIPNGASGSPPARSGHSAVYDSANNIMIIFGGCSGYCTPALNDVWTLSNANGIGGTPVWTQLSLSGGPAARTNAAVAYDQANNRMWVYSGQDGSPDPCSTFGDFWILSSANGIGDLPSWQHHDLGDDTNLPTLPPGMNGAAVAYDAARGAMTIVGGYTTMNGVCRETNATWQLALIGTFVGALTLPVDDGAAGSPAARSHASAVYDATGGRMILFGGEENGSAGNDVWSLSNATGLGSPVWTQLSPSGTPPAARNSQAAIFDSANGRMTIFGGSNESGVLNDSWVLSVPGVSGLSCNANGGAPNIVHADGSTETIGDILLLCTGGAPTPLGQPISQYTVTMTLGANGTSRPLPEAHQLSEALLMVDEPFPANPSPTMDQGGTLISPSQPLQILCQPLGATCAETGTGGSPNPYQTQPNVFLAKQTGPETLQWTVPIDPPGVDLTRVIRLTNVRANAHQLGLPSGFIPPELPVTVAIQGAQQPIPIAHPTQITALSRFGLILTVPPGNPIYRCVPHNASLAGGAGTAAFDLTVEATESYGYSFKPRNDAAILMEFFGAQFPDGLAEQNIPGFAYRTESGFFSPTLFTSAPKVGLADSGTRLLVKFGQLPTGIRLFVPVTIAMTGNYGFGTPVGQAQLVKADENGDSQGFKPVHATKMVGSTPVAEVTYSGSTGYATYEIVYSDPSVVETVPISVAVEFTGSPSPRQVTVTPSMAPVDTTAKASATAPIPRFTSIYAATPAFAIESCPASTLSAVVANKSGPETARVWNIQVNSGADAAAGAQIEGISFTQTAGAACRPVITDPALPIALGDIAANGSASAPVTINFKKCASAARFKASITLSANGGASNATAQIKNQAP